MEKSKLGIPVKLFAAAAALIGLYGGYVAAIVLVGYVLLAEENEWLKKFCLKVLTLMLVFSAASTVIYLIPNLLDLLYSFLRIFRVYPDLSIIDNIFNLFGSILSLLKTVAFLALAVLGFLNKNLPIPGLDKLLDAKE